MLSPNLVFVTSLVFIKDDFADLKQVIMSWIAILSFDIFLKESKC